MTNQNPLSAMTAHWPRPLAVAYLLALLMAFVCLALGFLNVLAVAVGARLTSFPVFFAALAWGILAAGLYLLAPTKAKGSQGELDGE